MRKDWEDNHGRAVYRWIRNDKSTPTVALRVNNQRNSTLTANPIEIRHLFEKRVEQSIQEVSARLRSV